MLKSRSQHQSGYAGIRTFGLIAAFWLAVAIPFSAFAQVVPTTSGEATSVEIPENLTREQVRDLIARMSDDQVRQLIISQLDKLAAEENQTSDAAAYLGQLRQGMQVAWGAVGRVFTADGKISSLPALIWQKLTENGKVSGLYLLFQLVGMLLVGWVAERLVKRSLDKVRSRQKQESSARSFDLACFGAVMGMIEIGAFVVAALLFVEITGQQAEVAQMIWHQVILCLVLIRLVSLAVRQVVSPGKPDTDNTTLDVTKQITAWSAILTSLVVLPLPMIKIASDFGVDAETHLLLRLIFGALFVSAMIVLIVRVRHYGTELISGARAKSAGMRDGLARIWWVLAIVYIFLIWFMSIGKAAATGEGSMFAGLTSLLMFVFIPYFDMGLQWLITRYFAFDDDETADDVSDVGEGGEAVVATVESDTADITPVAQPYEPGYISTALRYARILMVLAIIFIFMRLWNIDITALSSALVGERLASALLGISLTFLLAWALWGVISISIERKLDDGKGPAADGEGESDAGGLGGTRVETILPLIRVCIKVTLILMAVLISLSSLGVNIGPLIAGAGVLGIAIGFGAQTLVRDIVSGFFYLIDDAFRVGEYVVIDQIMGTVEKISVRSFQLRHHNGPVHTIPYGEIRTLTNWSRDWAVMKFELRIPFETDIDNVRKIIKKIGTDMKEDPAFGPLLLQPLKSQGVNRMDDSALIIRCKFTSIPGQQFLIRREAFTRIQKVFEENNIHFAPRRVLVESSTPEAAIKGAAAVLDQEVEGGSAPKGQ
jgi:small-conductance mechanosensitive channel